MIEVSEALWDIHTVTESSLGIVGPENDWAMICKWVLNPGKLKQCFTGTATVAFGIRRVTYPGKESYSILNVQEQYVILNISIARSSHICVLEKMNPMCYGKRKVSPTLAIAKGCYGFQLLGINLCKWLLGKQGSFLFFFSPKSTQFRSFPFLANILGDLYNCSHWRVQREGIL